MPYCTLDDLKEQLSETDLISLTDDEDAGQIDTSVTDRAIADADAEIDGYCRKRYALPFDPVANLIRKLSVDIALYNLYCRPGRVLPDERKDRYENAIKTLEYIADGTIQLGTDLAEQSTGDADLPQVSTKTTDRVFTRDLKSNSSMGTLDNF